MEAEDILYKEIVALRQEVKELRQELGSFKLKVYSVASVWGGLAGVLTKFFQQ